MNLRVFLALLGLFTEFVRSQDVKVVLYDWNEQRTEVPGSTCGAGLLFNEGDGEKFECACVTGVWAFYGVWCTSPVNIIAGSNFCFKMPKRRVSQVSLLSSPKSTFTSTLTLMTIGLEQVKDKIYRDTAVEWSMFRSSFITTGENSWELKTSSDDKYCLQPNPEADAYCIFLKLKGLESKNVTKVKLGCTSKDAIPIEPHSCDRFHRGSYGDERVCSSEEADDPFMSFPFGWDDSMEDQHNLGMETGTRHQHGIRSKRQATDGSNTTVPGDGAAPNATTNNAGGSSPPADAGASNATAPTGGGAVPPAVVVDQSGAIEDEDWVDPAQASVVNHPLVLQQLRAYLDAQISGATGSSTPYQSNTRGIPAFILLDKSLDIMIGTCGGVVKEDYFRLAFNAFTNIQTQSYHVKEPYISHPAYIRIMSALSQCYIDAKHYNFVSNISATPFNATQANGSLVDVNSTDPNTCEGVVELQATNATMKDNRVYNLSISDDKRGRGYEPIVETVWKIMLNAHSYCYRYFSDYYNDHHTFSVALLSLFTNEIQNIWMPTSVTNGTFVEPAPGLLLYGGIIGDHHKMIDNMDWCVAASRIGSAYPWLMSRPPIDESNKWVRRRRRSASGGPAACLQTVKQSRSLFDEMGLGTCD